MRVMVISLSLAVLMFAAPRKGTVVQQAPAKAAQIPNPYEGNELAARAGAKLFHRECTPCHGEDAHGMGKAPPLIIPEVRRAAPGALFWVLRNGSLKRGMPSYAHLPDPQIWQIVSYLKSFR